MVSDHWISGGFPKFSGTATSKNDETSCRPLRYLQPWRACGPSDVSSGQARSLFRCDVVAVTLWPHGVTGLLRRWLKFLQNGAAFTRKATMEWGTTVVKRKEVPPRRRHSKMFHCSLVVATLRCARWLRQSQRDALCTLRVPGLFQPAFDRFYHNLFWGCLSKDGCFSMIFRDLRFEKVMLH